MTPDWTPLDAELNRWADQGLSLPLWWRDDDAVTPTAALDRLHALAQQLNLPVHLAVVPARAQDRLADLPDRHLIPVVHGWTHVSHAPVGEKKAEFGAHRPLATLCDDAGHGLRRLSDLFGPALLPMFVPPWNRMARDLLPRLAPLGYRMISTFTPRTAAQAAPGLVQINTHLDPINWRAGKTLIDPDTLIAQLCRQLADRRAGRVDNDEPYGLLTHHLVHDEAIWSFTEQLLRRLLSGPTHHWTAHEHGDLNEPT